MRRRATPAVLLLPVLLGTTPAEDELIPGSSRIDVVEDNANHDPTLDVFADQGDALGVFRRLAEIAGQRLVIAPGDGELRILRPLSAHLEKKRLSEVLPWLAGSIGLEAEATRKELRLTTSDQLSGEALLRRALASYRVALLANLLHPEADRIRFEIANIHLALGENEQAIHEYDQLLQLSERGEELAMAWYRKGFAHASLGQDAEAVHSWLKIAEDFETSPLVAPAYLECVRAFRRQGEERRAELALRHVIEHVGNLTPETILLAGRLLVEGRDFERAMVAYQRALEAAPTPEVKEEATHGLVEAFDGLGDWPHAIEAAGRYLREWPDGPGAARVNYHLARAHDALHDPGTAILALRRARELDAGTELTARCDLTEGAIWASCGMHTLGLPLLFQASRSANPEIAARALALHARHAAEEGHLQKARESYERLELFEGHAVEARIGRARVALRQRDRQLCLDIVEETLPLAADPADRAALMDLAGEALRQAPNLLPGTAAPGPMDVEMPSTDATVGMPEPPTEKSP